MRPDCPTCSQKRDHISDARTIRPHGVFRRSSDSRTIQRFRCLTCRRTFSHATLSTAYRHKKRLLNFQIFKLMNIGVSERNMARFLRINRKTVSRKILYLGALSMERLALWNSLRPKALSVQFDDQETIENTKLKPLTITAAVEGETRWILGLRVARMPAKGLLAKKSLKKYGPLPDERGPRRRELFAEIKDYISPRAVFSSDQSPHYPEDVREFFPEAQHVRFEGRKPRDQGQGELKKGFDPIFAINHTFAMTRYGIAALIRKTWCVSKKAENLSHRLHCYALYHNLRLEKEMKAKDAA